MNSNPNLAPAKTMKGKGKGGKYKKKMTKVGKKAKHEIKEKGEDDDLDNEEVEGLEDKSHRLDGESSVLTPQPDK